MCRIPACGPTFSCALWRIQGGDGRVPLGIVQNGLRFRGLAAEKHDVPNVWQIASGEAGRKYTDLFLRHDVMFCGPGRFGPFDAEQYGAAVTRGSISGSKMGQVRRFAIGVEAGDLVLLRSGYKVVSIGVVDGCGYRYDATFDDVYGWDLQHTHRVIWQDQISSELQARQKAKGLFADRKQIPTFTAVGDATILDPIRDLLGMIVKRPLREL